MRYAAALALALLLGRSAEAAQITDFYVTSDINTGHDTGNCDNAAAPCLTLNYVTARAEDGNNNPGFQPQTIHMTGAWSEGVSVTVPWRIIYSGPYANGAIWNNSASTCFALLANSHTDVLVRNIQFQAINNQCASAIFVQSGGLVEALDGILFSAVWQSHVHLESGAKFFAWNPYAINGGGQSHISTVGNAHAGLGSFTVPISNGPTFGTGFFANYDNSTIVMGGTHFSGPINGRQLVGAGYSIVDTQGGGGCAAIPGSGIWNIDNSINCF